MSAIAYETIDCPYCGGSRHDVFAAGAELDTFRFYRRFQGFDQLNYVMCRECSLIFANPRIAYRDGTLNELFPTHVEKRAKEMTWRRVRRLRRESAACVRTAANLVGRRRGRFLEIGFGFGHALRAAIALEFDAVGTELFEAFVDRGRAAGLPVRAGSVDAISFDDDAFDIVYMEDVLEHLKDPIAYCREARRVLQPDGILFVHTWVIDNPTSVVDAFGER